MLVVSEHSACDLKLFDSNFEKKFALCFGRFSYFWVVFSDFEHFLAFLTFFQHWCFLAASSLFERSVGDLKLFGTFLSGKFFLMVLSVCPLISSCGEFSTIFDRFSAFVLLVRYSRFWALCRWFETTWNDFLFIKIFCIFVILSISERFGVF